jgi:hypothetical protein
MARWIANPSIALGRKLKGSLAYAQFTAATTLYAASGRLIPFNSGSRTGSTITKRLDFNGMLDLQALAVQIVRGHLVSDEPSCREQSPYRRTAALAMLADAFAKFTINAEPRRQNSL